MSRTYQYRKVMKPMLERKRRARINKCLDELKDLMVGALQSEGESITKLEKADVLELTVRHLRKLKQHHALAIPAQNHAQEKFRAGFGHCATEVRRFVQAVPGVDMHVSSRLLNHLGSWMSSMDKIKPSSPPPMAPPKVYTPPASPPSQPIHVKPIHPTPYAKPVVPAYTKPAPPTYTAQCRLVSIQSLQETRPKQEVRPVIQEVRPRPIIKCQQVKAEVPAYQNQYDTRNLQSIKIEVPAGSPVWRPW